MSEIPVTAWTSPLTGSNLRARTLAGEIGEEPTLLIFLRHLG
jgi:hypothetical protein